MTESNNTETQHEMTAAEKTYHILNSVMEMQFDLIADKYNIILEFLNELLKPKTKYYRLTQIKRIYEKTLKTVSAEVASKYIKLFEDVGLNINKTYARNKKNSENNDMTAILNSVLKQIEYKLKKQKDLFNNVCYSIVKK